MDACGARTISLAASRGWIEDLVRRRRAVGGESVVSVWVAEVVTTEFVCGVRGKSGGGDVRQERIFVAAIWIVCDVHDFFCPPSLMMVLE